MRKRPKKGVVYEKYGHFFMVYEIFSVYFIIITLIEMVLGELIFIYYRMLPPNVSRIFQKLLLGTIQEASAAQVV
jgi:hypothetical protein